MVLFFYREKKEKDTLIKKYHLIYQYITYGGRLLGTFDTQDSDSRLRRCCPLLQQQIPFSGSLLLAVSIAHHHLVTPVTVVTKNSYLDGD